MEQCVVTSMAAVCSLGHDLDEIWQNLINGETGIDMISRFDTSSCYTHYGAEIKSFVQKHELKGTDRMDYVTKLATHTALEALAQSKLEINHHNRHRVGVIVGSCSGGSESFEAVQRQHMSTDKRIKPKTILKSGIGHMANHIAYNIDSNGLTANVSNACAAGTVAIGYGKQLIEQGKLDVVVVCASDTLTPLAFGGFHSVKAISENKCSPFGRSDGITLGEGAGVMILESEKHAKARNQKILAFLTGYASSSDAYHATAPDPNGEGMERAMTKALKDAGLPYHCIEYINAHGTGTPLNDTAETQAIKSVFTDHDPLVSGTKGSTGHCLGATGMLEAIFSVMVLQKKIVPSTRREVCGFETALNINFNESKQVNFNHVMSNSLAFGGTNASLIISKSPKKVHSQKKSVYINDIGAVTALGIGIQSYWKNYHSKNDVHCRKIAFDLKAYGLDPMLSRRWSNHAKLLELSHGLITASLTDKADIGLIVGTTDGAFYDTIKFNDRVLRKGLHGGNPIQFPNLVYNASAGCVALSQKTKGYTATFVNGFQSGLNAVCHGFDLIASDKEKRIIASGVDELSDEIKQAYDYVHSHGGSLAEGSVSLFLDETPNQPYGEIVAYGSCCLPQRCGHVDVSGEALIMAIQQAVSQGEIELCDIDAVVGFSNGHPMVDIMEKQAYEQLFSDVQVVSIKHIIGEGRAYTSALQVAHGCMMLKENNDCNYVLITSFNFGGSATAMVIKKYSISSNKLQF